MASLSGLHHVALSVSDLDASAAWYQDVLGLREELRLDFDDRRQAILRIPGTSQQVGLIEHRSQGEGFRPQNLGLDHVAFAVASGEELAAWAASLAEAGADTSGVIETPFGGMVHVKDPDGIALALFWNR